MPLYVYDCPNCGKFEELRKMDDHIKVCPKCGENVSNVFPEIGGIRFVGKGFYETDYKKVKAKEQ